MSEKIPLTMQDIGVLDSMSNPVLVNGRGCRLRQDCGDLDGDGSLKTQPGVSKVLGAPMLANYASTPVTVTVTVTNGSKSVVGSGTAFLANAFPGDIFVGPDGVYYTIASVETDTGRPTVVADPDGPVGRAYLETARRTAAQLSLAAAAGVAGPSITVEET
jgi:hypothetical protein